MKYFPVIIVGVQNPSWVFSEEVWTHQVATLPHSVYQGLCVCMLQSSGHLLHSSLISVLILLPLSAFHKKQFFCWEESNHCQLSHQVSEPEQSLFHSWSVTCNHSHPPTPLTHSPLTHTYTHTLTHSQGHWYGRVSLQWPGSAGRSPSHCVWPHCQHLSWWTARYHEWEPQCPSSNSNQVVPAPVILQHLELGWLTQGV